MGKLTKEETQKLIDSVDKVKDEIEVGFVITDRSFCCIGDKVSVIAAISSGIQQLVDDGVFNEYDVKNTIKFIKYNKDERKKELIKDFLKAINMSEEDLKEVLNEEK
jgi:hypothetical protein